MTLPCSSTALPALFRHRFGLAAELLADALHMVSLDLVRLIAEFLAHGALTPGCEPLHLLSFPVCTGPPLTDMRCWSIAISPDDNVWVGTSVGARVYNANGRFLFKANRCHSGSFGVIGIAFDVGSSEVFLSCCLRNFIVVCGLNGSYIRKLGNDGAKGKAHFVGPRGIAIDGHGFLFVADSGTDSVVVCQRDGTFVRQFGSREGRSQSIYGISVHDCRPQSEVWVTDLNCLRVFSTDGTLLRQFATDQVHSPLNMAFDRVGNVMVCEEDGARVTVFEPDGKPMMRFPDIRSKPYEHELKIVNVAVSNQGRIYAGNKHNRVHVFSLT